MHLLRQLLQQRRSLMGCALALCLSGTASGQSTGCPASPARSASPAEVALGQGNLQEAESLFQQAVAQSPQSPELIAGLVRTRVRLNKLEDAATMARSSVSSFPQSAPVLVAFAEVQLREGQPWEARDTLDRAAASDPCLADIWLLRSRIDRLDSMHATERADIARAYALDPKNPEVKRAWNRIVTPANDAASSAEYLRTTRDVPPDLRKSAEESIRTSLQLLTERTQTCTGLPVDESATLPLLPTQQDGRHIDGYQLKVGFGGAGVALMLDTAASGFYISRAVADANGLAHRAGDPENTVHADAVQAGPLTFHDCVIGVSDIAFPNKKPGFVGTDLFAQYLVKLNFPDARLSLLSLPKLPAVLPGDRPQSPELAGFAPVYHRQQYLLMPVTLNGKERRLFVLDSGIRLSAMTLPVAHLLSSSRHGFTNSIKTVSGATIQTYNDSFHLDFAHLHFLESGMLELDPSSMEEGAGMKLGGLIGLDILQAGVLSLDYRDGLVQFEPAAGHSDSPEGKTLLAGTGASTAQDSACKRRLPQEVPRSAAIVASNTGMWDVHQLKLGQTVALRVERPWETDGCHLEQAALLHGRVVSLDKGHDPDPAHLGLVFDRAECFGKSEQSMPLRLISVIGESGRYSNVDSTLPTSLLSGAGRQIDSAAGKTMDPDEVDLHADARLASVKTGTVVGIPSLSLETAGPACSAVFTGSGSTLRLGAGTRWLLVSAP